MSTFWDVATKQLDESRAECRVKDRELEEMEERHQMEVKIYKQKVKHLLYEQENHLAGLKAENMVSISSYLLFGRTPAKKFLYTNCNFCSRFILNFLTIMKMKLIS